MMSDEQDELAKQALRNSASYQYEIDVLREALRKLVWEIERADDWDAGKQRALNVAIESARAAIDRTDGLSRGMSDMMGDTDGLGLVLYSGTRDELQAKLRARDDEITRLRSYVEKLESRLEIDCVWRCGSDGEMVRVEVPKNERPDEPHDGIFCRDETIKLQHEAITRLRSLYHLKVHGYSK